MKNNRAEVATTILLVIVLLGAGGWGLSKTKWFNGDAKRATQSTQTSNALLGATEEKDGKAAAVFAKIGETNSEAPDSPQKKVIGRFVPIGMSLTGAPDPAFMLELEKLKVAELSGKLAQADRINDSLMRDANETKRELAKAIAAKRASDQALEWAAAEKLGAEKQAFWFMLAAGAAAALYLYVKLTHLSPGALAEAVYDIKKDPTQAIAAIDGVTTRLQQKLVNFSRRVFHE